MTISTVTPVLHGATAALTCVAGLFFWSYWRKSKDRFFMFFALSFWIESVNRLALGLSEQSGEDTPWNYAVRLLAYALILLAIWDKNRPGNDGRRVGPAQAAAGAPVRDVRDVQDLRLRLARYMRSSASSSSVASS